MYRGTIICGAPDPTKGDAHELTHYVPFFGCDLQVYCAEVDPRRPRQVLVKASLLAHKFNCATNTLAMYLSRRRANEDGIFQATSFQGRPRDPVGLKTGSYFVSIEACEAFAAYSAKRNIKKKQYNPASRVSRQMAAAATTSAPSTSRAAPKERPKGGTKTGRVTGRHVFVGDDGQHKAESAINALMGLSDAAR